MPYAPNFVARRVVIVGGFRPWYRKMREEPKIPAWAGGHASVSPEEPAAGKRSAFRAARLQPHTNNPFSRPPVSVQGSSPRGTRLQCLLSNWQVESVNPAPGAESLLHLIRAHVRPVKENRQEATGVDWQIDPPLPTRVLACG